MFGTRNTNSYWQRRTSLACDTRPTTIPPTSRRFAHDLIPVLISTPSLHSCLSPPCSQHERLYLLLRLDRHAMCCGFTMPCTGTAAVSMTCYTTARTSASPYVSGCPVHQPSSLPPAHCAWFGKASIIAIGSLRAAILADQAPAHELQATCICGGSGLRVPLRGP